jgi:hypothetical protein
MVARQEGKLQLMVRRRYSAEKEWRACHYLESLFHSVWTLDSHEALDLQHVNDMGK